MPALTPNSEVTFHTAEDGLQIILNAYKRARPEEFRIVSAHYADGTPDTTPLSLNDDGEWLDYAFRLSDIMVDMAPANPALHSPIPPATGQFEVAATLTIEFKNFAEASAVFNFPLKLWFLGSAGIEREDRKAFIKLHLDNIRIEGIGPAQLRDYFEYILGLLIKHALKGIRLPTTMNADDLLTLVMSDLNILGDTVQVYGWIDRPTPDRH